MVLIWVTLERVPPGCVVRLGWGNKIVDFKSDAHVEGMFAHLDGDHSPKSANADPMGD